MAEAVNRVDRNPRVAGRTQEGVVVDSDRHIGQAAADPRRERLGAGSGVNLRDERVTGVGDHTEDWSICAPGVADCAVAVNAIAAAAAQSTARTRFEFLMLFVPPET